MEEIKSYDQIYNDMVKYIIAHQNEITDFNSGGVLTSQIEAMAREIALLYINVRVGYSSYLRALPSSIFDFQKKEGDKAAGQVVFSRTRAFSYETIIPAGTIVAAGSLNFLTTEDGKILSGTVDSAPIAVTAEEIGSKGNLNASEINKIVSTLPSDIVRVENPNPSTGGRDIEDWNTFAARFNQWIIGLGKSSISGICASALGVPGIISVNLVEHFPAASGYNFTLYAEDGSGGLPANLKTVVEEVVIGTNGKEGQKAAGINARILAPTKVYVNPNLLFRVNGTVPVGLIETEIKKKITSYVNSLKIGESCERREIYDIALHQPGVRDVISCTPETLTPQAHQIIRPQTITVNGE